MTQTRVALRTSLPGSPAILCERSGLIGLLLLVWWSVLLGEYMLPHTTDLSLSAAATAEGSPFNTALISAFAVLGACSLTTRLARLRHHTLGPRPKTLFAIACDGRAPRQVCHKKFGRLRLVRKSGLSAKLLGTLLALLGMYLVWALASVMWSVDPGLTLRRHVRLCLVVIGSLGLGAGYYASLADGLLRFARHVLAAGAIAVVVLWVSLLASGNVDLLNPTWAAKDFGAGTRIGYPIAFSLLAAFYLFHQGQLRARTFLLVLVAGLVSLFAQKVRFIFAFTVLVLLIQHLSATRWTWQRAAVYGSVVALSGWSLAMLVGLLGTEPLQQLFDAASSYATLERADSTLESLTGRTPLWGELMRYAAERPWTGYGFGAFWNPEYMLAIWTVIPWHPPVGHDGYLDETLATGVVGLALFLSLWLTGLIVAWRRFFIRKELFGALVGSWMLFFLLTNIGDTIMQYYFQFPFYASLIGLFALATRRASLSSGQ